MLKRRSIWKNHLSATMVLMVGSMMLQPPTFARKPPASVNKVTAPNYYIGPGDQIQIAVFGYEEYTGQQLVLSDGTITLPLIGTVIAANRTPGQLTKELTLRLRRYLVDPVVNISLVNLRPIIINVGGEVQRPGTIQLRSVTNFASNFTNPTATNAGVNSLQAPTVSSALLEAGGVSRNADIRRVVLKRYSPTGNSPTITINLWNAIFSENAPRDLILQDGDSIFVPKVRPGDALDRRLVARSTFAPRTVRVRVVGEVKKPGEVDVPPNSSLSSAVAIAGGPTDKAKLSQVIFVRLNDDGRINEQTINLSNLNDNYQIQQGDVLIVPKSKTSTALDFMGNLGGPLGVLLNIFR
ncbi:polysaccharide biosynthesis/export family protein [Microcoleus sp. FACHB-831]|jgi:polysaccharide export outer membrane protein|uniref:polysaccharide biosynthesis/export family protein n=1 Tax=Microcoleus sp. FACHB-831 TaxID=2692827 RepID=UPI0016875F71|nr:polysaccharide biosynthesis/export family protein [Microcoleus sp. FACHB-831]MBD1924610.1 polysaccharide biosynthesis/export family protein [Microcoleus sp. FACHB-831]